MVVLRNLVLSVLVVLMTAAVGKVSAATSCIEGCACDPVWEEWAQKWTFEVDCFEVFDCEETYPDFCDTSGALEAWCSSQDGCPSLGSWVFDYIEPNCETTGACWGKCWCGELIPD